MALSTKKNPVSQQWSDTQLAEVIALKKKGFGPTKIAQKLAVEVRQVVYALELIEHRRRAADPISPKRREYSLCEALPAFSALSWDVISSEPPPA